MMINGELDACVCERFFGDPGIHQVLLGEYRLALVYPRDWGLEATSVRDLELFRERDFITYEPGQTIRSRGIDFLTSHFGKEPRVQTTVSGSTSIIGLVQAGIGYAIVPEWVASAAADTIRWMAIDDMQTVKVYFASPAFLARDPVLLDTREICSRVMGFRK